MYGTIGSDVGCIHLITCDAVGVTNVHLPGVAGGVVQHTSIHTIGCIACDNTADVNASKVGGCVGHIDNLAAHHTWNHIGHIAQYDQVIHSELVQLNVGCGILVLGQTQSQHIAHVGHVDLIGCAVYAQYCCGTHYDVACAATECDTRGGG